MVIEVVDAIQAEEGDMDHWTEFVYEKEKEHAATQGVVLVCLPLFSLL